MKTTELVETLLRDRVAELGFTLCDVEFQKEYGNWTLTLFIDRQGGVTIDDCELEGPAPFHNQNSRWVRRQMRSHPDWAEL